MHGEIQIVEEDGVGSLHCGNRDQTKMNVARRTGYIGTQFWSRVAPRDQGPRPSSLSFRTR